MDITTVECRTDAIEKLNAWAATDNIGEYTDAERADAKERALHAIAYLLQLDD